MGQKHSIDIEPYDPDALKNQDLQSLLEHISETERSKPSKFSDEEAAQELVQQLFKIDVSIERLYEAIPFEPLRSIRDSKPRVFVFILENLIEKLEGVILQGKIEGVAKNTAVLNVVRALTRFFVVMHEDPNSEVHPFLWVKPQKTSDQSEQTHQDPFKSNLPDDINVNSPEEFQKSCLAEKIVYTIINLLFINGFTIRSVDISKVGLKSDDYGTNMDESRVLYWESKGDSYNLDIVNNIDPNRIEVLRALLACLCQDLYITSSEYRHDRNPWVRIVVESEFYPSLRQVVSATTGEFHPAPRPSTLFWSLLNIVLNFNPNQRGIMGSFLPTALTDISSREVLVGLSIHLLLILVEFRYMKDYGPASKEQPVIKKDDDLDPADEPVTQNYYLALFRSIRRPKDLDDTLESIIRLLMINVNAAEKLGIGLKLFDAFEEIIILNWKLVEENSAYFKHILQMDSFIQLVRCILFYMYRYMDDSSKIGLLHACALTLLRLSSERDFSIALNTKYDVPLPINLARFDGTLADLLIVIFHKIIVHRIQHLETIFHVLLTIIQNISPYLTRLTLFSSAKLLSFVELFSSQRFLSVGPQNYKYLGFILDSITNLIQYQYYGSAQLIYVMIRRANLFYDISGIGDENALKSAPPMKFFSKRRSKVDDLFKDNCLDHLKIESSVNFVPDSEFLTEWKENLSTKAILNLLDYLIPKLKTLAEKKGRLDNEFVVLEMIQSSTVVGILPPPHSIVVRRYMSTRFTTVWFATYIWGLVFLKNEKPTVFEPKAIKLFTCGYSDPSRNKNSVGNIGQLAVDVLVNSLGSAKLMCKIGYLDHDSVLPVIGNDALDIADPGAAFFSLEVFYSRELQILAVQQRAPFLPGKRHRRKFIQDLSSWTKSVGIRKIILPCSFPGHRKSDSHLLAQLKRDTGLQLNVFLGGRSIPAVEELCERMNWNIMDSLEPKMSQGEEALIGPLNKGLGIQGIKETAGTFLEEPENQIIVLGVFANEGDNSFEGISVGTGLVQLILSMLNGSESAEFIKKISIIPPLSWHHAFGGAHNPRVYY